MISDAKQNLIRKRLAQGVSQKDIAEEAQVSLRTVQNYKAKMPASFYNEELDTGDETIKDNSTLLTKQEEKFTKKLQGALQLYEDDEEGWCYHLAKTDFRLRTSGNWWCAVAYPESVPEGWMRKLEAQGFEVAISPLHDKDTWNHDSPEMVNLQTGEIISKGFFYKKGDKKKAHWHIIVKCDRRMSYVEANNVIRQCTYGPYIQKCRSLKNSYEYFFHTNDLDKYHYERDEATFLNGFHLEPNKHETGLLQNEILRTIREEGFTQWTQLIDHYLDQPEYTTIICTKPAAYTSLINSQWRLANPNGRIQRVEIVKRYDRMM